METSEINNINDILRADLAKADTAAKLDAAQSTTVPQGANAQGGQVAATPPSATQNVGQSTQPQAQSQEDARVQRLVAAQRQLREEREAWKREQGMSDQDRADLQAYRDLKARAEYDPVGVAEHFKYKPDQFAAKVAELGAMTPERRAIMELKRQNEELMQWRQQETQRQQKQHEQYLTQQVVGEIAREAEQAGDQYDLTRRTPDGFYRVLQKIQNHWNDTSALGMPEKMSYAQALELVEQELLDKTYAHLYDSPKIRSRVGAVPTGASTASAPSSALAARQTSGPVASRPASTIPGQGLSENEGLERAGAMLFKQFNFGR